MKALLDRLNELKGWIISLVFVVGVLSLLWGKLIVLWDIGEDVAAIRTELEKQANKDAAIDYDLRDYMCEQMGLRNKDCPHFEGVQIILVAPSGAAGGGP